MQNTPKYKRVLLKLSGEALAAGGEGHQQSQRQKQQGKALAQLAKIRCLVVLQGLGSLGGPAVGAVFFHDDISLLI